MSAKKKQSEIEQLESEVGQLQSELRKLEESRGQRKGEIEALETEQRGFVVAARVHKDPEAQGSIERLAGEIAKRRTDDIFDCDAIAEISTSLEAKKAILQRQRWKERCAPLCHKLELSATGELEREALKLAGDLKVKLQEMNNRDGEIIDALREIHPLLYPLAGRVAEVRNSRGPIISHILEPLVENPFNRQYMERIGYDFSVAPFEEALRKLEEVAEMESAAERD